MDFNDRRESIPTSYHPDTAPAVRSLVESHMAARKKSGGGVRLKFHYGDNKTGQAWGYTDTGYVGRSMGSTPVPLVVNNQRSMGGNSLSTNSVVKVESTRKNRAGEHDVLYQHPKYKPAAE